MRKVFSLALCFLSLYFFLLPVVVSFSAQLFIAYAFYFVCHRHKVHRTLFPAIFRKTQQFSSSHKTWQSVSVALVLCPTAEYKIGAGVWASLTSIKTERAHQSTQCAIFQYTQIHIIHSRRRRRRLDTTENCAIFRTHFDELPAASVCFFRNYRNLDEKLWTFEREAMLDVAYHYPIVIRNK